MLLTALLCLSIVSVASSEQPFQCYSCGVFLTAPTPTCKGEPKKINCTNSRAPVGCISITALNRDGSYYVEKRCADTLERKLKDGECVDLEMPKLKEARKCFCTQELCNAGSTIAAKTIQISISVSFIAVFIFHLLNKSVT